MTEELNIDRVEVDMDGTIQRFIIHSNDRLSLQNIDYNLDFNQHDMSVSADEISKILFKFSCIDY